ncbi:MAG: VapC toxin family PIN domain ribonuclease [Cyanobacteria bacterium]|nr:VapC toxin family PIN domain ribonuclease [Cyanobacteriota bacterium]
MSNSLFIDTSGWASIIVPTEQHHTIATHHFRQAILTQQPILTSNYIITELVALLQSPLRLPRSAIFSQVDIIRNNTLVQHISMTPDLDKAAWELCKKRPDKPWSLVDCSSFVIMQQLNIQTALTTVGNASPLVNRHFEQAGFIRLLK